VWQNIRNGLAKIYEKCLEPKETNRQIDPLFKRWKYNGGLGIEPVGKNDFEKSNNNAILNASDIEMKKWCKENLSYDFNKGLDFVGRFNNKYVIGEAKFLTDFGGHQNTQFADAINLLKNTSVKAIKIAVLDGVLYIRSNNKMYKDITTTYSKYNTMSALLLREFLYSL